MSKIASAIIALALGTTTAGADETLLVRGLFCRTEAQILEASDHLRSGLAPAVVAAMMNREAVHCVYADRIDYAVERPAVIDADSRGSLFAYEATLTGIRVGDNLRAIEPPLPIYFLRPDRIKSAVALGRV